MTGSRPAAGPIPVLAAIAVALALLAVAIAVKPTLVPGTSAAEDAANRDAAIRVAAKKVTTAFLDVDYHDMDSRIDKVLSLSTGEFKDQYDAAKVDLKAATEQAQTVATSQILEVGIGDADEDAATVYVAADSEVTNVSIKKEQDKGTDVDNRRYYRFQLGLINVDGTWLLNELQFIT